MAGDERDESKAAALPLVISAHQNGHILDRNDQRHRPENEAYNAQHMRRIERQGMRANECLAKRIERACANIAKYNPDRAHCQSGFASRFAAMTGPTISWAIGCANSFGRSRSSGHSTTSAPIASGPIGSAFAHRGSDGQERVIGLINAPVTFESGGASSKSCALQLNRL